LQAWDQLRLQLLARGYRQITYIELACPRDGDFRGSIDPDYDALTYPCPKCNAPSEYAMLGRGFTRRPTSSFEQVAWRVPKAWKTEMLGAGVSRGPRLPIFKGAQRTRQARPKLAQS
jgi:hypothetical protein